MEIVLIGIICICLFMIGYIIGKSVNNAKESEKKPEKRESVDWFSGQDPEGTMFFFGADGEMHSIPPKPKKHKH